MDIPDPYGAFFERYGSFNALQLSLHRDMLQTSKSVVLSAPTGSGKTVVFELAIVRMLLQCNATRSSQRQQHTESLPPLKAVYVAPLKALCAEKFSDWKSRFKPFNVHCMQVTGDTDVGDLTAIRDAQVVVTTPEKWDSLTRRWRDCPEIANAIRLFMIDEVHLLSNAVRGPVIEAIVSRMKSIACFKPSDHLRFVVASATLPNIGDLRAWIGGDNPDNVLQLAYTNELRALPLERHILGYNSKVKGFQFDMSLNYKLADVLRKYADRKATLIFCNSRKSTQMAADILKRDPTLFPLNDQQKSSLAELAEGLRDPQLRQIVVNGIAFHHAGLSPDDRARIEDGFRKGHLMILLCTNTLAMGVNLPCHLVVIKSTEIYSDRSLEEYSESTILQMIGRAGRAQFEHTKGVAVVMTYSKNVLKYENLMNGKMPVESQLHKQLTVHLNAEIALGTIDSEATTKRWLRSTFLHVRCLRDPATYGLKVANSVNECERVDRQLEALCLAQLGTLQAAGLITISTDGCAHIQTTHYGRLMAKYYLSYETMRHFRQIRGTETLLQLLNWIVFCKEFTEFTLRVNEKKPLNALNVSPIRFPIRGRIKTKEDKVSCLIQAVLGNLTLPTAGLAQEAVKVMRIGDRLAKCLLEYLRLSDGENELNDFHLGCHTLLLHTVTIVKCFHAKLWENSEHAAKQLRKIDTDSYTALANAGKTTLQSIATTDARTIEQIVGKSPPFGEEVLREHGSLPEYRMRIGRTSIDTLLIYARQMNDQYRPNGSNALLIVGDSANNILHLDDDIEEIFLHGGPYDRSIQIKNTEVEGFVAHIIHNSLVGVDVEASIGINKLREEPQPTAKKSRKRKEHAAFDASIIARKARRSRPKALNISTSFYNRTQMNLSKFRYTKSKLQASHNKSLVSKLTHLCNARKQILNGPLKIYAKPQEDSTSNVCTSNVPLIQTKVTDYLQNRKYYNLSPILAPTPNETPHEKSFILCDNSEGKQMALPIPDPVPPASAIGVNWTQRHNVESSNLIESLNKEKEHTPLDLSSMKSRRERIVTSSYKPTPVTPANSEQYFSSFHNSSDWSEERDSRIVKVAGQSAGVNANVLDFTNNASVPLGLSPTETVTSRNSSEMMQFSPNYSLLNGTLQSWPINVAAKPPGAHYVAVGSSSQHSIPYHRIIGHENSENSHTGCKRNFKVQEQESRVVETSKTRCNSVQSKADSNFKENELNQSVLESSMEVTLKKCYRVALKFSRLKFEEQNYSNFKQLYLRLNETQTLVDSVSEKRRLPSDTTRLMPKRHQLDGNQLDGNQQAEALPISPKSQSVKNPFRLQIIKEVVPTRTVRQNSIDNINRRVMKHVLNAKSQLHFDDNTSNESVLAAMEEELGLNEMENESPELTFDEYCAQYMMQ